MDLKLKPSKKSRRKARIADFFFLFIDIGVKCKNIVSIDDKFNDDLKEDQMCNLCTMFAAYDNWKGGLGPA